MNLGFIKKFLKQVSKITDKKLSKEILSIIEHAEKASALSEIKNLKI